MSNRTEIQTYKVEERTFGTPCRDILDTFYWHISKFEKL